MDYIYEDKDKDIRFNKVKNPQTLINVGPIGIKDRLHINDNNVDNIDDNKPLINAIDIDWNGAEVDDNLELNTTADLLAWIKSKNSSQEESGDSPSIPDISYTITAYRWYKEGIIPNAPVRTITNQENPNASDNGYYPNKARPINWTKYATNRPEGENWILWQSQATKTITGNTVLVSTWSTPVRISGIDGTPGEDLNDREYIYKRSKQVLDLNTNADNPSKWTAKQEDDYKNESLGWLDNPQGVDSQYIYEYQSFRDKKDGIWSRFSVPTIWSHYGENGTDGDGVEYVFARTKIKNAPYVTSNDDDRDDSNRTYLDDEYLPLVTVEGNNWLYGNTKKSRCTDNPAGISSEWPYEWVLKRKKKSPVNGKRTWEQYSGEMTLWAHYIDVSIDVTIDKDGYLVINGVKTDIKLDQGSSGSTIQNVECKNGLPDVESPTKGMVVIACEKLWYYDGTTWITIGESNGVGDKLHIAYAKNVEFDNSNKPSRAIGFTVNPPSNMDGYEWIGICVDKNDADPGAGQSGDSISPDILKQYKWNRIGGSDGNGSEWIYIRTKVSTPKPEIDNSSHEGDNGDPTKDEFYPRVKNLSDFGWTSSNPGNIEYDTWRDDEGGPTAYWPYRWRAQRKYQNGKWENFGTVCADGNYAFNSSTLKLTLDNDSIILDDDTGQEAIKIASETKITVWDGYDDITDQCENITITLSHSNQNSGLEARYDENTLDYFNGQSISGVNSRTKFYLWKKSDAKLFNITDQITYTAEVVVNPGNSPVTISAKQSVNILDITAGEVYKLIVSPNSLPLNNDKTFKDSKSFKISANRIDGANITTVNNINIWTSYNTDGELYLKLYKNESSKTLLYKDSDYYYSNGTVTLSGDSAPGNSIEVELGICKNNSFIVVDSETVDYAIQGDKGQDGTVTPGQGGQDGKDGKDGQDGVSYQLICNPSIVVYRKNSTGEILYDNKIIECTAKKNGADYSGTIYYDVDGNNEASYNDKGVTISYNKDEYVINQQHYRLISNINFTLKGEGNNILAGCSVPVIEDGNKGVGTPGETGKMFYPLGVFNPTTNYKTEYYIESDYLHIPMVFYDDGEWNTALNCYGSYYYLNVNNINNYPDQGPTPIPNPSSNTHWIRASNFGLVMTQGIFSEFAKIGSGIMSGDYLFTTNGTINGEEYIDEQLYPKNSNENQLPAYLRFDSKFPGGKPNEQSVPFLDRYKIGDIGGTETQDWRSNEQIITSPFYIVANVEYQFKCSRTSKKTGDNFNDLRYIFKDISGNNINFTKINDDTGTQTNGTDSLSIYSDGNTYKLTFTKNGYYVIAARPCLYNNNGTPDNPTDDVYYDAKLQNITINISEPNTLFVPNYWVDLKSGRMSAAKGNFVVESDGSVNCTGIINRRTKVLVIDNNNISRNYDKAGGTNQDNYECLMSDDTITYGSKDYTGGQGSEDAQVVSRRYVGSGDADIIKFKSFGSIDDGKIYLPYPEESIYKTIILYNYSSNANIEVTSLKKSGNSDIFYTKNKSTASNLVFSNTKKIVFYSDGQYWSIIEAIKMDNNQLYYDEWLV